MYDTNPILSCMIEVVNERFKKKKTGKESYKMAKGNLGIEETAVALGLDKQTLRILIQQGVVDYGRAYKLPGSKRWSYLISPKKFYEETGVALGGYEPDAVVRH